MNNKTKILKITWLDHCNKCDFQDYANVHTKNGKDDYLYEGDAVYCPNCDNEGSIECDMGCAYVQWEYEE